MEYEDVINFDDTQDKLKTPDMTNISFTMYKFNEKSTIQSTDFLVQSVISKISLQINTDLSFESFHYRIKGIINSLSANRIHAISRL